MIPKVVGYAAFQSYGDLPYPSLKAGKRTLDSNEIWEQTVRNEDKESFYKNSNYHYSNKQVSLDSTVQPPHFKNVYKANKAQLESATSSDFFQKTGNSAITPENPLLKTGCEHWKSTYQASIVDPYAKNRAKPPEWSLNRPPYVVETKVGPSEYKKQYGQIGENPRDRLNQLDETHPRAFDELRLGTSQEAQHVPGYTGFIPSIITNSKAIEHGNGTEPRTDFMKTNLKENYHTKIPGYAGHVPRSVVNQRDQPRQSCFSN
ncbi:unnamed protein product [Paramecium sonneborni]|uniref:Uncharacterized protein n=1 Tax=Paramecium sonneborni TaxID=65129 RepID=A0A8S1LZM5_9CILI|nr:unnamed protein product [Paramecium sonneborni]